MQADTQPIPRRGVLGAGNWLIDHVKMINGWPAQDALATIRTQSDGNGGGAYNVLKGLAKLQCGFPLAGIGLVGRDADGATIRGDCEAHGIDHKGLLQIDAAPTSYTDVMTVASTGRRTFFHQHGANALLGAEHFDFSKTPARIFYLGYMCLLHRLDAVDALGRTEASRVFEQARKQGLITVADLVSNESGDFPAIINPSLPHVDYLFLNEYELARLLGVEATKDPDALAKQAAAALDRGVGCAVIVHLPEGALCVRRGQPVLRQPSVRMPREMVAGTVGAGDAFGAGFLLGLHENWDLGQCLELAVCAAAASLRSATSSDSLESWKKCLAFGRQLGFHQKI